MANKLVKLAKMMLEIDSDVVLRFDYETEQQIREHPTVDDFEVIYFEQIWADTSCGFGGIAGRAITVGDTVVLRPNGVNQPIFVYFNGRFAYSIPNKYESNVLEDIRMNNMASVGRKGKYFKEN